MASRNIEENDEDMGIEVAMPPSYWNKWTAGFTAETSSEATSDAADDDSAAHTVPRRPSLKKVTLLALSIAAVSAGGAVFAVNGTSDTTKTVDYAKVHKTDDALLDDCGGEDTRRVLVVPGSESFHSAKDSSAKKGQMRVLKGSSTQRKRKCAKQRKCPKNKNRNKIPVRKLGQQLSNVLTTASPTPGPTLCSDVTGDNYQIDPDLPPRFEPLPVTAPPTPPPRRTDAPSKAVTTPAPTKADEPITNVSTPLPTNLPTPIPSTQPTPLPSALPTSQPTKATPLPTTMPTSQPSKATPLPTAVPTNKPSRVTSNPTPRPTNKPLDDSNDSNEDGFLGFGLVRNNDLNLRINAGLEVTRIARKNRKVLFSNGDKSDITYHEWMDGAGVIPLEDGGYVYVSNSENDAGTGGVWGLYFNKKDEIVGFKKLLGGTTWNCSGGVSPWKTWISCEETSTGQCHEVDPDPSSDNHDNPTQTLLGGNGGKYEAVAVDDREDEPVFFVTEDKSDGALRRVKSSCRGWGALHGTRDECTLETTFLRLRPNTNPPSFEWTTNENQGRRSAANNFPYCEGIAFHNGKLSFMSKTLKKMFTLDLDSFTYEEERTGLKFRGRGSFDGQPDQTLDDPDSNYMYFTEEDYRGVGVYARHDKDGFYYTLFEDTGARLGDETVGTATSPDGKILFVGFQESGELFTVKRKDGGRF